MDVQEEFESKPESVWDRIDTLESQEVEAVIRWTIEHIRHDAALLIERLEANGYLFSYDMPMRSDELRSRDVETLEKIEEMIQGRLPAFYRAFCTEIGCLLFDGRAQPSSRMSRFFPVEIVDQRVAEFAPLELLPLASSLEEVEYALEEGFEPGLMLITDPTHLAGYSGGPPLGILARDPGSDPQLWVEADPDSPVGMTLLEYLRVSFRHGGFFGLSERMVNARTRSFIDELTAGFKGF